ncbi:MAG: bifunctional 2-C-methyl-D-erythritol 4-phosphate cytidylyltransferase/2-C-methyl-D-erythritol 2,4-cyclodiphosphate synthase [Rhodospirillaceae bacterium]|nr:bifunctional 2-C-methyl-D-erythritol 4-phosphate cytidylyltransferase/2-C-methyl-D-erythritol 2,4-cyclodiphosphate synthase [Rhodospirillaceae bacterium]|tara:strand:- start:21 stop:1175 length:1155 start_codon:yes stop_codon:yes gene_type:complete
MSKIAVVVVAAGKGERAGGDLPKQYRPVAGRSLLAWTLDSLTRCSDLGPIQVVIGPGQQAQFDTATEGLDLPAPVEGGTTRQESVLNGLEALEPHNPDAVLIHDAARPYVTPDLITRLTGALGDGHAAAIPALPVNDTIKRTDGWAVVETVDRSVLVRAQTPQAFDYQVILQAHRDAIGQELTDDAAVVEHAGLTVVTVPGNDNNTKVTMPEDFEDADRRLGTRETRVGTGFDVHAFAPGDHIMLCGVRIEHDMALDGDSDADVGLHVLVDAMLGAMGEGDLGRQFPPGDPTWKGRASCDLVAVACDLLQEHRARIVHADLTLICEEPKLARHQPAMTKQVASLLGIDLNRVNVKVTSTDKLGFTGRGEGIAGQAVVTLDMPAR